MTKMRDRLYDEETMVQVARDAFDNVYDGPGSGDAPWKAVAIAIRYWVLYGTPDRKAALAASEKPTP